MIFFIVIVFNSVQLQVTAPLFARDLSMLPSLEHSCFDSSVKANLLNTYLTYAICIWSTVELHHSVKMLSNRYSLKYKKSTVEHSVSFRNFTLEGKLSNTYLGEKLLGGGSFPCPPLVKPPGLTITIINLDIRNHASTN